MNNDEREIRAFESIIVSQLLRERDPMDPNDLPELTEAQKKKMRSRPSNLIEQLMVEVENESENECTTENVCDVEAVEEEFVGMNRAEAMDEETRKALDEARKEVIKAMKMKRKEQGGANS